MLIEIYELFLRRYIETQSLLRPQTRRVLLRPKPRGIRGHTTVLSNSRRIRSAALRSHRGLLRGVDLLRPSQPSRLDSQLQRREPANLCSQTPVD